MLLFSIRDAKSETFGSLAECRTDDEAIRSFLIAIQNAPANTLLSQFPVDFSLFKIGSFDPDTGLLVQDVQPQLLITGLEVMQMLKDTSFEVAVRSVPQESENFASESTEEEVNV